MKLRHILSITIWFIASSCARTPNKIPFPTQSAQISTQTTTPVFATNIPKTETIKPSYHCEFWEPLISENHEWIAIAKSCQNPGLPSLEVIGVNGADWIFESKEYDNSTTFARVIWSKDSKHLYFSPTSKSTKFYFYDNVFSILMMDLESGDTKEILQQEEKCKGISFNSASLSPDENIVAYLSLNTPLNNPCKSGLVIRDLSSNARRQIALDNYYDGGFFLWSPDSTKLAFIVSELDSTEYYPKNETVMVLDLTTMTLENLVTTEHGYVFLPYEWINGQLVIRDRTNNSLFIFDSITKQLIPYTP